MLVEWNSLSKYLMNVCGSRIVKYTQIPPWSIASHTQRTSNDYTCALQCPGSGLRPLQSHHHLRLQSLSPSMDLFVGCFASHGYRQRVHWSTVSTPKYPGPRPLISCAVPCWTPEIETYLHKQEFIQNHFWHKRATKTT